MHTSGQEFNETEIREDERRRVLEGIDVDTWDLSGSIATGLKELGYLVKERSSRDDASAVWEAVRSAIHQGLHGKLKDTLRSEPAEPAETAEATTPEDVVERLVESASKEFWDEVVWDGSTTPKRLRTAFSTLLKDLSLYNPKTHKLVPVEDYVGPKEFAELKRQVEEQRGIAKANLNTIYRRHNWIADALDVPRGTMFLELVSMVEAMKKKCQPIPGPPDLEGVEDDALFVVWYTRGKGFVKHTTVEAATLREFPDLLKDIEMHIPLGVVKSPEPEAELPKCQELYWEENWDDDNNTFWEAAVSAGDGEIFMYRIHQRLSENRIVWYSKSEEELGGSFDEEEWGSADEAKAECLRRIQEETKQAAIEAAKGE